MISLETQVVALSRRSCRIGMEVHPPAFRTESPCPTRVGRTAVVVYAVVVSLEIWRTSNILVSVPEQCVNHVAVGVEADVIRAVRVEARDPAFDGIHLFFRVRILPGKRQRRACSNGNVSDNDAARLKSTADRERSTAVRDVDYGIYSLERTSVCDFKGPRTSVCAVAFGQSPLLRKVELDRLALHCRQFIGEDKYFAVALSAGISIFVGHADRTHAGRVSRRDAERDYLVSTVKRRCLVRHYRRTIDPARDILAAIRYCRRLDVRRIAVVVRWLSRSSDCLAGKRILRLAGLPALPAAHQRHAAAVL